MTPRSLILDVFSRPLYVLILIVAAVVLVRGHNEPGGGFIGGLLAVVASVLWAVAFGSAAAERRMPLRSAPRLAAVGMLLALTSGLPAWLDGAPYLTHLWTELPLIVTLLPVSTVLLFDLGVLLCVWGAVGGYALALIGADAEAGHADAEVSASGEGIP